MRQKSDKWYKIDLILDWTLNKTALYIDNEYQTTAAFFHGKDKFWETTDSDPEYTPVNGVVIYTLSPGARSDFKDLRICKDKCLGGEKLEFLLSGAFKLMTNAYIITASAMLGLLYI